MPNTLIRDVMSPASQYVFPDDSIQLAAERMRDKDIGFLPVIEADKIIGILTDRDITIRAVADGKNMAATCVRECMTHDVYYCFDDQTVNEICRNMGDMKVSRLPVVTRNKRLVGVVSYADLSSAASATIFMWSQQELKSILPAMKAVKYS